MLVECAKCGAPLDVSEGTRLARCNYCGSTTRVGRTRTIAIVTPAQWAPPPVWTPPPQSGLPVQALAYRQTRKVVRSVVTIVVVSGVLGIVIPISMCFGIAFFGARSTSSTSSSPTVVTSGPLAPAPPPRWDGVSPLECGANQHLVLEDVETPVGASPGVLIQVTDRRCKLTFRRVKLRGATLVRGGHDLEIDFESSSFAGELFAELEGDAEVRIDRSVITVDRLLSGGTKLSIRGPTHVRARRGLLGLAEHAEVELQGPEVVLESEGEGILAGDDVHIRARDVRIVAGGGTAIQAGASARLELDSVVIEAQEGLRLGRHANVQMRMGSVTTTGAALRGGRGLRGTLDGTRVEGVPAFDLEDLVRVELRGATIVGERRVGRQSTIREQ
ncbi:MAG: hypothetical protein MUE69_09750 [Myxococcota bacterium]|nr:hypothetical protein [Myxococcota bacterium]